MYIELLRVVLVLLLLKKTVAYYNRENTDVHCAMIDLSKAYDTINIGSKCGKLKTTWAPGHTNNLIEFVGKNTFVCISYKVGNGVCHGVVTSGFLLNFYIKEHLTDIANLPLGCELSCCDVGFFCTAEDNAFLARTKSALPNKLVMLAPNLKNLSLKINVEKSCYVIFKPKRKKSSTALTLQGHL